MTRLRGQGCRVGQAARLSLSLSAELGAPGMKRPVFMGADFLQHNSKHQASPSRLNKELLKGLGSTEYKTDPNQ